MRKVVRYLVALIVVLIGTATSSVQAWPGVPDREENYGYFTNIDASTGGHGVDVFDDGLYTYDVDSFIDKVKDELANGDRQHKTGAAFIIQTMIGELERDRPPTAAQLADWESRVREADARGLVQWDVMINVDSQSYYSEDIDDVAFEYYDESAEGIRFLNEQGAIIYQLHHKCANPVGDLSGLLTAAEYDVTPSVSASKIQVSSGETIDFEFNATNAGPDASQSTPWNVQEIVYSPGSSASETLAGGDGRNCDYYLDGGATTCRRVFAGPSRVFNLGVTSLTGDVPENVRSVTMNYPVGTRLCYVLTIDRPSHNSGVRDRWSDARCATVSTRPTAHFLGGDVSVGNPYPDQSATCSLRPGTGNIYTVANGPNNGSSVEYAAFVRGVIDFEQSAGYGFGTASRTGLTLTNVERLSFANTELEPGRFGSSDCMTDYYERYRQEIAATPTNPGSVSLTGLTGEQRFNYDGDLTIEASDIDLGARIIIVVDGTVTIDGNIRYGGAADPEYEDAGDIPGLAIMASGDIAIRSSVTQADGAYISKGTVTTCAGAPVRLSTRVCNRLLTLNGVLLTDGLQLPRTAGGSSSSAGPAERFNYTNEMFFTNVLNDTPETNIQTIEQRDLPPRY